MPDDRISSTYKRNNGSGWWKINLMNFIWIIVVGILSWGLWTTRRSDALADVACNNTKRIAVIEQTMPTIRDDLSTIKADLVWIKGKLD